MEESPWSAETRSQPIPIAFLFFVDPQHHQSTPGFDAAAKSDLDPAKEDAEASESSSLLGNMLRNLSRTFQTWPQMDHVEFLFVMSDAKCYHFATYLYGYSSWYETTEYYRTRVWHAVPIAFGARDVRALQEACERCKRAPYSVWRYLASTQSFGCLSQLLKDDPQSPAHCGGLAARVLKYAMPSKLHSEAPWYSPSLLYTTLSSSNAVLAIPLCSSLHLMPSSTLDHSNPLLTASDRELSELSPAQKMAHLNDFAEASCNLLVRVQQSKSNGSASTEFNKCEHLRITRQLGWVVSRFLQYPSPTAAGHSGHC